MTSTEKIYIMNEDYTIIRVCSTSIILLIFMSDIYMSVIYVSYEGCFTFIVHHFVLYTS